MKFWDKKKIPSCSAAAMRMATVPRIPRSTCPPPHTEYFLNHFYMPRIPKTQAAKKQIECQKVSERSEAAIKEYQGQLTAGLSKPSIAKLAQKHGIPEHI